MKTRKKGFFVQRNSKVNKEETLKYDTDMFKFLGNKSANSDISNALTPRKPAKPQQIANQVRSVKNTVAPKTSAASSTSTPSAQTGKRNRRAPVYYRFANSFCSVSDSESILAQIKQRKTNPVIKMIIQQRPIEETSYELPVVSLPDPRIRPPKNSPRTKIMLILWGKSTWVLLMPKIKYKEIKLIQTKKIF